MRTIDIPDGTAVVRTDITEARVRQTRLIETCMIAASSPLSKVERLGDVIGQGAIGGLGLTEEELQCLARLQDATIVAALVSWSLPDALPTMATIQDDLTKNTYKALAEATTDFGKSVMEGEDFDPPDPYSPEFTSSPTMPSVASGSDSRATQASESPDSSSNIGTSTSIATSSPA